MEKIKLNPNRYQLAYQKVFADLPPWKKLRVIEDSTLLSGSRFTSEFSQKVAELAESDAEIFMTTE